MFFLRAYNPFPTFKNTSEISYFINDKYSGKGLGKMALKKLINVAREQGVTTILASMSSKIIIVQIFAGKTILTNVVDLSR